MYDGESANFKPSSKQYVFFNATRQQSLLIHKMSFREKKLSTKKVLVVHTFLQYISIGLFSYMQRAVEWESDKFFFYKVN